MIDDIAHQDQSGAVARIIGHRVSVEHHRKPTSVGDAGEQRDHLVVAFKRVNIDGVAAARKRRQAGAANKMLDAGFGEHVGQPLLRHPQRLDAEERLQQPLDLVVGLRHAMAIAGQGLQLAFLALEPAAE